MDSEKLLPNDQRIDPFLDECGDDLRLEVEQRRLSGDEVLDPSVELGEYDSFRFFAQFIEKEALQIEDETTRHAVYRAMVFAYEVAIIIYADEAQFNAVDFIRHIVASPDREKRLREDTQYYLADNPHTHDLIQFYVDELDMGRNRQYLIEMAAAVVFMLVERNLAENWMHETAQNLSMKMFEK